MYGRKKCAVHLGDKLWIPSVVPWTEPICTSDLVYLWLLLMWCILVPSWVGESRCGLLVLLVVLLGAPFQGLISTIIQHVWLSGEQEDSISAGP